MIYESSEGRICFIRELITQRPSNTGIDQYKNDGLELLEGWDYKEQVRKLLTYENI